MTRPNVDSSDSRTESVGEENLPTPVLDDATLQQWKSELQGFVSQTQLRLQGLSQSLAEHQARQQEIAAQNRDSMSQHQAAPVMSEAVAEQFAEALRAPTPTFASSNFDRPGDAIDPLDRLNAIKMRLAQQIENAS